MTEMEETGELENIEFRYPELEDKEQIQRYYRKDTGRSCENTFANVYLWAKYYQSRYAVIEDTIVFKNEVSQGIAFSFPIGEEADVRRALEWLMQYCEIHDSSFRMYCVTEEQFALLETWWPGQFQIEYDRDAADYVYESEKLATLSGKKLHGKRNHINRFKQTYENWSYETLNDENLEDCFQMALSWRNQNGCDDDPEKNTEMCVTMNALRLYKELELTGGVLRVDGQVVAFCIGEPVGADTFVVHIEKAFSAIDGAYPMINQQFVQHECTGYSYINREEDMGLDGLRQAKLSYRPVFLVNKGVVTRAGESRAQS